jgi:uncharacterized protein
MPTEPSMPMIRETIVVTRFADGRPHLAPMGAQAAALEDGSAGILLQPFRPSATLDNLLREGRATLNHVDDVRVFAGCIVGRRDWPVVPAERIDGLRLAQAVAHAEAEVAQVEDDEQRPRIYLRVVHEVGHQPFAGFNRAKAAVIEAAVLASRAHMLPAEKISRELEYLRIAIDKTAGEEELEAWGWLLESIEVRRPGLARPFLEPAAEKA